MSGNGVKTGLEVIVLLLRETRQELLVVLSGCTGAVAGPRMPASVACRFVASSRLTTVTSSSASG